MLLVVADDFSGAAEIAGVAHRAGLGVRLQTRPDPPRDVDPDLLVVDTHTRDCPLSQLGERLAPWRALLAQSRPGRCFKKIDSVLRGHVAEELTTLASWVGCHRALVVPGNPRQSRTMRKGRLFVDGVPLEQTEFACDPIHPATDSRIDARMGRPVACLSTDQAIPQSSTAELIVGQAGDRADLDHWVQQLDADTLAAGAADFFEAWLRQRHSGAANDLAEPADPGDASGARVLFIGGSVTVSARRAIQAAQAAGCPVITCADDFQADTPAAAWRPLADTVELVCEALHCHGQAILCAAEADLSIGGAIIAGQLAAVAALIRDRLGPIDLFVEGGTTARAVADRLGTGLFEVLDVFGPGVVRLSPIGAGRGGSVTVKPGSYRWPESLWPPRPAN